MEEAPTRNAEGHIVIKGTRRPDGTWRKDRIMRDGYVPEPARYIPPGPGRSHHPATSFGGPGAQSSRLAQVIDPGSTIPAGIPPGAPPPSYQFEAVKKPRRRGGAGGGQAVPEGAGEDGEVEALAARVEKAELDPVKMIKKLEKKLREIDEILRKAVDGRTPEQLEKAARKTEIAAELAELKKLHQV